MWVPFDSELVFRLVLVVLLVIFGVTRGYYTRKAEAREPGFVRKRRSKETRTHERTRDVVIQDLAAVPWAVPMLL
jgi:hypothetical protein